MRIIAIETSCDETAIAVAEFRDSHGHTRTHTRTDADKNIRIRVLSHLVSSQARLHARFGGVVPNLARREHEKNLVPILVAALRGARQLNHKSQTPNYKQGTKDKLQNIETILAREPELLRQFKKHVAPLPAPDIDAIAVTYGPGLAPALWTGVNFARALALLWKKPLIPVNHMAGHLFSAFLQKSGKEMSKFKIPSPIQSGTKFPILALLVSGGHTELMLAKKPWQFQIIGETQDDAVGEAFDKVGRILGLPYPGGPEISRLAAHGDPVKYPLPSPMINTKDYNFSFSGLKTAVFYLVKDLLGNGVSKLETPFPSRVQADIAASFEKAAVDVLVKKTIRAAREYKAKTILSGGGVSANKALRAQLGDAIQKEMRGARFLMPDPALTGDNALMIAAAAYMMGMKKARNINDVRADANARLGS